MKVISLLWFLVGEVTCMSILMLWSFIFSHRNISRELKPVETKTLESIGVPFALQRRASEWWPLDCWSPSLLDLFKSAPSPLTATTEGKAFEHFEDIFQFWGLADGFRDPGPPLAQLQVLGGKEYDKLFRYDKKDKKYCLGMTSETVPQWICQSLWRLESPSSLSRVQMSPAWWAVQKKLTSIPMTFASPALWGWVFAPPDLGGPSSCPFEGGQVALATTF